MSEVRKAHVTDLGETQSYKQEDDCFGTYHREGYKLNKENVHAVCTWSKVGGGGRRGRMADRQR